MVNTILREADLFCPNSVRINFTIYLIKKGLVLLEWKYFPTPKILDP
ncbi:ABC transporter ATP-binding protein [Lactobacillus helveticus]|nr:ABC transporter ATP-binding protein [Lactobacillus helveticus]